MRSENQSYIINLNKCQEGAKQEDINYVFAYYYYVEINVLDVEATMLSNHCKAVKKLQADLQKCKEKIAYNSTLNNATALPVSWKINHNKSSITLGERKRY